MKYILRSALALCLFIAMAFTPFAVHGQPTVDGDLTDTEYVSLGTATDLGDAGNPQGFGTTNLINEVVYYPDTENDELYVGVDGILDDGNGFGIWVKVTGPGAPTGIPAGDPLGIDPADAGVDDALYITGHNEDPNTDARDYTADFEVHYMTALGAVSGDTEAYVADRTGNTPSVLDLGSTDQNGTSTTSNGIEFAFNNDDATADTGAEWRIPFSVLGVTSDNDIEVFAMLVSNTAYFSAGIIPGDPNQIDGSETDGGGNPGFNATWGTYNGGPFNTSAVPLPVELGSFTAALDGTTAQLEWETLSETNNAGFEVQHADPEGDFEAQGFVEGEGTTDTPQQYTFSVDDLAPGTHRFRLKQTDFDGTSELTEAQTIEVSLNQVAMLETAPNPVRGSGTIQFAVQEAEPVTVSVYNVLGQRVETLYDGTPTPDQVHTVSLDTSTLSSGTYFVRIEGATMQKTRRVAVVR